MKDDHLTREALHKFLGETTEEDDVGRLLLHLLAACPGCYATCGYVLDHFLAGAYGIELGSIEVALAELRARAPALFDELAPLPAEEQRALVAREPRFRSWGLAELLCTESVKATADDAAAAVRLAELAVSIAALLGPDEPAEEEWLQQLRAYAWAHLGNARRVQGDLWGAVQAFAESDDFWEEGYRSMGDVLGYEARRLDLMASLRRDQRRLPEALELLDRALVRAPDESQRLRALVKKATVLQVLGDSAASLALLEEAAASASPGCEPRLLLSLRHNLLDSLTQAGRLDEAEALLPEVRALAREHGGELDGRRLTWVEGRLAAGRGQVATAIERLDAVRQAFAAHGIGYDTALVTLELATVYAQEGRAAEVEALAREVLPLFQAQDIHREALAALAAFLQAVEAERATAELVGEIAGYLRRARHDPGLRFTGAP